MDKRSLIRYPIKMASKSTVSQACRIENTDFYLHAHTALISHQRMLIVSLYEKDKLRNKEKYPSFRIFMTKENYIAQDFREEEPVWRTGRMEHLTESTWYKKIDISCCDDRSATVLNRFFSYLNMEKLSPVDKLIKGQKRIMEKRLEKKHQREKSKIDQKMREVKKLPKNFMDWIDETAMAHSRYIYYQYSRKKYMDGYCTHCHSDVKVSGVKHRKIGVCPNCGKKVLFLAAGKATRILDHGEAVYFQKTKKGFVVRFFSIYKYYGKHYKTPEIRTLELKRIFYEDTKCLKYEWRNFKQTGEMRWCAGWDGYTFYDAACYTANLEKVLTGTPYQYCAIKQFADRYEGAGVNVPYYLKRYGSKPFIEYMVKAGLYHMVEELTQPWYFFGEYNQDGKNLLEVLGVTREQFRFIQQNDMYSFEFRTYKKMLSQKNCEIPEDFRSFCQQYERDISLILELMQYTTLHKVERYCSQQTTEKQPYFAVMRLWRDYLRFAVRLGYNTKNSFVLFPKRLIQAHNHVADVVQKMEEKELREKMKLENERAKSLLEQYRKIYSWTDGKLSVVVPEDLFSIREEGHTLHHCVANYTQDVADGKTIILFIRRNSELTKPFYTIEVTDESIRQCQGFGHCGSTEEVQNFVDAYEQKVLKPLKLLAQAVS